jgi:hypothetical protein
MQNVAAGTNVIDLALFRSLIPVPIQLLPTPLLLFDWHTTLLPNFLYAAEKGVYHPHVRVSAVHE